MATPQTPDKEARIEAIVGLMSAGQWVTGLTFKQLAKQWGLTPEIVKADSAEASRVIHRQIQADPELKSRLMLTLEGLISRLSTATDPKSSRVAIEAIRTLGNMCGANAPAKTEVTLSVADFFSQGFTPDPKDGA